MSFRLEYEVGNAGWATCRVALGEQVIDMTASYLHDSLHQLCEVVASVAGGAPSGTIVFMDEPGEHHVNLTRVGESDVNVEVVWHSDWTSWGPGFPSTKRVVHQELISVVLLRGQTCASLIATVHG